MLASIPSPRLNVSLVSLWALVLLYGLFRWSAQWHSYNIEAALDSVRPISTNGRPPVETSSHVRARKAEKIIRLAADISPIEAPYKYKFKQLGQHTVSVRQWIQFLDAAPSSENTLVLQLAIEGAIRRLYPFLSNSPRHPKSHTPFQDLRDGIRPGTRGIAIPTGKTTMRYAAHLISSLQSVLGTQLPIMIVYAGDQDFPPRDRKKMQSRFTNVEFLDILTVVDDSTLKLGDGGWAIKAFAALYAPYEQVILADADCVFVQRPEVLFEDSSYIKTGALLFHDRLLWQHSYRERHEWWRSQIDHPSATLNKSLVWSEDYAEEGDSGVVVLDKSRLDVLTGLLHVAWQNTQAVRDEVTYKLTYGDKESWWFGLELAGAKYAFENHYGSMVGWPKHKHEEEEKVCSFYIGHVDANNTLLWYNGGLLVSKRMDTKTFGLPTHLMIDGNWHKSSNRKVDSCMAEALILPKKTVLMLAGSVSLAKEVDMELGLE